MGNSVSIRNVRTEDLNGGTWTLHLVNNLEKMKSQLRNLHPIPEAVIAMSIWGKEYSEQRGGSMDFYDALSNGRKHVCADVLDKIKEAIKNHSA